MAIAKSPISSLMPQGATIFRFIGYTLLILAAMDLIVIIDPPLLPFVLGQEPLARRAWELNVIGQIVERVPVPLIAYGFIFMGNPSRWSLAEKIILKGLSWFSLLLAAAFLFMTPLTIFSSLALNRDANQRVNEFAQQRQEQIEQVEEQLAQATPETLEQLAARTQGVNSPQELREQLSERIQQLRQQDNQRVTQVERQGRERLKSALKWAIGALFSAAMYVFIFVKTDWVRQAKLFDNADEA